MIDNSNIDLVAKMTLEEIKVGKYEYKYFFDTLDCEKEYMELMEILYKCGYVEGCAFFRLLSGKTIMNINGYTGITITTEGERYLTDENSYIIL